jgi:hypothetical protein
MGADVGDSRPHVLCDPACFGKEIDREWTRIGRGKIAPVCVLGGATLVPRSFPELLNRKELKEHKE